MLKRFLKNERGLTLIELLAVVVILGIIAAIAVPSIGGIIDNTKKDAHVANATQAINSAKIAVTSDKNLQPASGASIYVPIKYLIDQGYLESLKDPDNTTGGYVITTTAVPGSTAVTDASYVLISRDGTTNAYTYTVKLYTGTEATDRGIFATESGLKRDNVVKGNALPTTAKES